MTRIPQNSKFNISKHLEPFKNPHSYFNNFQSLKLKHLDGYVPSNFTGPNIHPPSHSALLDKLDREGYTLRTLSFATSLTTNVPIFMLIPSYLLLLCFTIQLFSLMVLCPLAARGQTKEHSEAGPAGLHWYSHYTPLGHMHMQARRHTVGHTKVVTSRNWNTVYCVLITHC